MTIADNIQDICDAVKEGPLRIGGRGSSRCLGKNPPTLSMQNFHHLVYYRPDDLVVRVGAGFLLDELAELTAKDGLCLPIHRGWLGYTGQTVGGLVATGMPHYHQEQTGAVRDWVTGMSFVTGDGSIVRSGADVVKSVAGFDIHRALVGSRGSLAAILEVALRLKPAGQTDGARAPEPDRPLWASRVPTGWGEGIRDPSGKWLWTEEPIALPPYGWSIHPDGRMLGEQSPLAARFGANLKQALDPQGVFSE